MFLVGDAPPHMDYAQDTKYPDVLRTARERGIVVNAVQAGGARDTERVWRTIAQMGHGRYIPIPQDGGHVVVIETPYDCEIIELQDEINGTVIPYGPRERRGDVEQKTRQAAAAPMSVAAEMSGYHVAQRGKDRRRSHHRRRRSGRRRQGRTAKARRRQGRRLADVVAPHERG